MVRESLPEDLQEFEQPLASMLRTALDRYIHEFGHVRATTSTIRGERNNIHDCMTAVGKTMFRYVRQGNRFVLVLGRYLARPKKFNERLETANYPTQGCLAFEQQRAHAPTLFPELEPINIDVGYVPDAIDPRNSTLWIRQPGPDGWVYQLRANAASSGLPTPMPVTDPDQGVQKTRVKPKQSKKIHTRNIASKE